MNQKQIINKLLYIAASSDDADLLKSNLLNFVADLIKEGVTVEVTAQDRSFSVKVRENLLLRDHCTCAYCNRAGTFTEDPDGNPWQVDHIVPVSRGGLTAESNAALSCWKCNNEKSGMTPTEYLRSLRFKKVVSTITQPLELTQPVECEEEITDNGEVYSPLLSGKPARKDERELVRSTYTETGSINQTCRVLWGAWTVSRGKWVKELLQEGEVMQ